MTPPMMPRSDGHVVMKCRPQADGKPAHHDSGIHCPFCEEELLYCAQCQAGEGTLTSICPDAPISEADQDRVYAGLLDFNGERWVVRKYRSEEEQSLGKEAIARTAADRLNKEWRVTT